VLGLALALPAFAGLGVTIAALTAGLNGASALGGLLLVPLAIPILIFGAGTLDPNPGAAMELLAATSLAITALSPFAAGAALRAARD
jgi:heme exporter protein B